MECCDTHDTVAIVVHVVCCNTIFRLLSVSKLCLKDEAGRFKVVTKELVEQVQARVSVDSLLDKRKYTFILKCISL